MTKVCLCSICNKDLDPEGPEVVTITDRHKKLRYYHEGCIKRECPKFGKGNYNKLMKG